MGIGDIGSGDALGRGGAPGEMGDALPAVGLGTGRTAVALAGGSGSTYALLDDGSVKGWGSNTFGQLGTGDILERGNAPGEMGDALLPIALGSVFMTGPQMSLARKSLGG